jgi:hypothetical protein
LLGPPISPALTGISLDKVNVAASPLGGIPLAGIALGGLPLGGIPSAGHRTEDENEAAWCDYVNAQRARASPVRLTSTRWKTMLGLALMACRWGHPARRHPARRIPLRHPTRRHRRRHALGEPARGHQPRGHPLGGIPLGGIDMSPNASPLGGITLGSIPASAKLAIFECPIGNFVCADTDTLAQAKAAGAIKQTAKLRTSATTRTRAVTTSCSRISSRACRPTRRSRICWPPSS